MSAFRFRPGKEWGSKARKAEDSAGRKRQERQAAIVDQLGDLMPWQRKLLDEVMALEEGEHLILNMPRRM